MKCSNINLVCNSLKHPTGWIEARPTKYGIVQQVATRPQSIGNQMHLSDDHDKNFENHLKCSKVRRKVFYMTWYSSNFYWFEEVSRIILLCGNVLLLGKTRKYTGMRSFVLIYFFIVNFRTNKSKNWNCLWNQFMTIIPFCHFVSSEYSMDLRNPGLIGLFIRNNAQDHWRTSKSSSHHFFERKDGTSRFGARIPFRKQPTHYAILALCVGNKFANQMWRRWHDK